MIVMVCVSVIATGFVMHLSAISQPMPLWVERVFLQIIPCILCISPGPFSDENSEPLIRNSSLHNHQPLNRSSSMHNQQPHFRGSSLHNRHAAEMEALENGVQKVNHNGVSKDYGTETVSGNKQQSEDIFRFLMNDVKIKNDFAFEHTQWRRVSIVVDRLLLAIFSIFIVLCTLLLSIQIVTGSEESFDDIKRNLAENW